VFSAIEERRIISIVVKRYVFKWKINLANKKFVGAVGIEPTDLSLKRPLLSTEATP